MDDLALYRVFYEDPDADPNDPCFEEIMAIDENDAMASIVKLSDKDFTHAEFYEEDYLFEDG